MIHYSSEKGAFICICRLTVLLGITMTPHLHCYSQPVAQETNGMLQQVGLEVVVDALPLTLELDVGSSPVERDLSTSAVTGSQKSTQ